MSAIKNNDYIARCDTNGDDARARIEFTFNGAERLIWHVFMGPLLRAANSIRT